MIRLMVNGESSKIAAIKAKFPDPEVVGFYSTGTPDIAWTPSQQAEFPNSLMVGIDQGFNSPPTTVVPVRDVESGAWSVGGAVNTAHWDAPRPTIYCARDTLSSLASAGWRGDVWLAWPGFTGSQPPDFAPFNIVAVQNVFTTDYQLSLIYDEAWPSLREASQHMFSTQVNKADGAHIPFPAGTFKAVTLYRDFLDKMNATDVRVAVHSASKGYFVFHTTLDAPIPKTLAFTWPDVDAISVEIQSGLTPIGVTLL